MKVDTVDQNQIDSGIEASEFERQESVRLTRTTSFMVVDRPDIIRLYYEDALAKFAWQKQDITSVQNAVYFFWTVDTKSWEDPPCNATPETGLPVFILKLTTAPTSTGETRVQLVEGIMPGF